MDTTNLLIGYIILGALFAVLHYLFSEKAFRMHSLKRELTFQIGIATIWLPLGLGMLYKKCLSQT